MKECVVLVVFNFKSLYPSDLGCNLYLCIPYNAYMYGTNC